MDKVCGCTSLFFFPPIFVEPSCGEQDIVVIISVCVCMHCACVHPDLSGP